MERRRKGRKKINVIKARVYGLDSIFISGDLGKKFVLGYFLSEYLDLSYLFSFYQLFHTLCSLQTNSIVKQLTKFQHLFIKMFLSGTTDASV
jgi:hypothetical protein